MQQVPGGGLGFPGMSMALHSLPAFNFAQAPWGQGPPYTLKIASDTTKSRVETQIRIKINLSALPPGVQKLHLPKHTISKPKLLIKPTPARSSDTLELHTALYCTSALQDDTLKEKALERSRAAAMSGKLDPLPEVTEGEDSVNQGQQGAEVHICKGCITRERKRASRKKLKKPEDDKLWLQDEGRRIVVFNSLEVRDWSGPNDDGGGFSVDCQMRIACYCRHHAEKQGFNVIFTITDYQGNLIGQAMSAPIMITDDHKTHGANAAAANSPGDNAQPSQPSIMSQDGKRSSTGASGVPIRLAPNPVTSELQSAKSHPGPYQYQGQPPSAHTTPSGQVPISNPRLLSRPASPTSISGPSSKKRKASGSVKVPSGLSMTRIDTGHVSNGPPQPQQGSAGSISSATSPSPFPMSAFQSGMDPLFAPDGSGAVSQSFVTGPMTPNGTGNEQILFAHGSGSRATSYDTAVMTNHHMYSAPTSTLPSRAPSPSTFRNSTNTNNNSNAISVQQQTPQFAQTLVNELYNTMPMQMSAPPQPPSVIHKIIPAEGPKSGGIEVTILGSGFHRGLEVMFGDIRATTTTFWGESSLVCLLPPSPISTTVLVSLKHLDPAAAPQVSGKGTTFKYTDDDEQQLMRTALTVLGHKMNGKIEDIADVARRIIGNMDRPWNPASGAGGHGQHGGGGAGQFNSYASGAEFEGHLLKVLDLIDLDDSPHKPRLNLRRATGQTMLHLACSLGLHRFVAGLLARGANPDIHDKGGYTPLHMASLNNHPEIVKRLMLGGADPSLRTLSGLTAADVARSRDVVCAIRRIERQERSRSVSSPHSRSHSRASSMASIRSLWDPQTSMAQIGAENAVQPDTDPDTGEESPEYSGEESLEYSTENFGSEDELDANNDAWAKSRRSSVASSRRASIHSGAVQPRNPGARVGAGLHSPAAAVTALKDQMTAQMHNFQQAMALHLQNMPQFPYLPQMPAMTPLADYQAFLNGAAVFQRFASLVPNARPGSAGSQSPTQASDSKWWNMSSLAAPLMGAPTPPPAYEEIYPQGDLDTKQASAVGAAADAEADEKCAALYDQGQASVTNLDAVSSSELSSDESGEEPTCEEMPEPNEQLKTPELLQIGRKNAITKEQQENLQRARAAKLKTLSRDSGLFFIWLPLLFIVLGAWLYNLFPTLPSAITSFLTSGTIGNIVAGVAPLG
jgi:hypothetical protein